MMRVIRLLHVYAGLVVAVLMFILALTGAALVYKDLYWQWTYAELDRADVVPSADEQAEAIEAAWTRFGPELRSVKLPEPGVPAYHLYLDEGEAFLSLEDTATIDRWDTGGRLMSWLFDLHAHLMAGERGELLGGVIGLAGCVMALTGLVLWLPARAMFAPRNLWPRGLSRRHLLSWHRDAGMLLSPVLLLLLLTGSGMVFYAQAQKLLNGLFGDPVPVTGPPARTAAPAPRLPDAATLERVTTHFEGARIVFWYPAEGGNGLNGFRLKQPCELHPNGRSYIYTDTSSGEILHAEDACALPPGERMVHAIYPLHAAKTGHESYRLLAFLASLVLAGLSLSGVITYVQKLRRGRRRAPALHPGGEVRQASGNASL